MFVVSEKIIPTTVATIKSVKIIGDNAYVPFYYQRDNLGRLIKDKKNYFKKKKYSW